MIAALAMKFLFTFIISVLLFGIIGVGAREGSVLEGLCYYLCMSSIIGIGISLLTFVWNT